MKLSVFSAALALVAIPLASAAAVSIEARGALNGTSTADQTPSTGIPSGWGDIGPGEDECLIQITWTNHWPTRGGWARYRVESDEVRPGKTGYSEKELLEKWCQFFSEAEGRIWNRKTCGVEQRPKTGKWFAWSELSESHGADGHRHYENTVIDAKERWLNWNKHVCHFDLDI